MSEEECILLVVKNEQDDDGIPVQTYTQIPVYCREKSVRMTEFYDAMRAGIKPRIILELRCEDWELSEHLNEDRLEYATKVIYKGGKYDVIRTYMTNKSRIQVTLG